MGRLIEQLEAVKSKGAVIEQLKVLKSKSAVLDSTIVFLHMLSNFLSDLAGHIRIGLIRMSLYRHVFRVDVPGSSVIYSRCRFYDPWNIRVGHHTIINDGVFLDGRNGILIGNNVSISRESSIYTLEHDITSPTFEAKGGTVTVGDWVFIGTRAVILPGVTLGEGAVVAAGAVVTKDVAPWTMVGGVPARFIRTRPQVRYVLPAGQKCYFQ